MYQFNSIVTNINVRSRLLKTTTYYLKTYAKTHECLTKLNLKITGDAIDHFLNLHDKALELKQDMFTTAQKFLITNKGQFDVLKTSQSNILYQNEDIKKLLLSKKSLLNNVELIDLTSCVIVQMRSVLDSKHDLKEFDLQDWDQCKLDLITFKATLESLRVNLSLFSDRDNKSLHLYPMIDLYYEAVENNEKIFTYDKIRLMIYQMDMAICRLLSNIENNEFLLITSKIDDLFAHTYLQNLIVNLEKTIQYINLIQRVEDDVIKRNDFKNKITHVSLVLLSVTLTTIGVLALKSII
jgi:hypothetical protein